MIVFFCYKKAFMRYINIVLKHFKYDYVVLSAFDEHYFDKACAIIPIGISAQNKLRDYPRYKDKYLISSSRTYDILDDKIMFYHNIKHRNLLKGTKVELIPTYDNVNQCLDRHGQFIVKQKDGAGSKSNEIKKDSLHRLIKKYADQYQIQDLIDIKSIYSVNCFCVNGKLINSINFIIDGFIEHGFYEKNSRMHIQETGEQMIEVIRNIAREFDYSGFMEIEFIHGKDGKIYLMEANPRISSNMLCMENDKSVPFNELLFYPMIDYLHGKSNRPKKYDQRTPVTFYGRDKIGDHHTSTNNSNVIKFTF